MAGFGFIGRDPQLFADILGVLTRHGLIFYFLLYFVGGYLMYATLFTTIGAFCETPRDAQTLLGPLMILLTIPIVFMGQAVTHPDAPAAVSALLDSAVHAVPDGRARRQRAASVAGRRHRGDDVRPPPPWSSGSPAAPSAPARSPAGASTSAC